MMKHVAVLGYGVTGESVVRHLVANGVQVTVIDTRPVRTAQIAGVEFVWEATGWPDIQVDHVVVSPGLSMDHFLVLGAAEKQVPLLSDIDLFFACVDAPVIGVTGTNGKSTVTSLVAHMLNEAGVSCGVGGNLGVAALDIVDPEHQCYVLELSSFQLERSLDHPFCAATILNISQDHMDKHGDMQAYALAKQRIYKRAARCVYNRMDPRTQPPAGVRTSSFGPDAGSGAGSWGVAATTKQGQHGVRTLQKDGEALCRVDELPLVGRHNELNVLAACALVDDQLTPEQMRQGLRSFRGLKHRYEKVCEMGGVAYINDSKATNLGASLAALESLPRTGRVILIAGGDAKGADLSALANVLRARVRHVMCLGQDAAQIADIARSADVPNTFCASLEAAVALSHELARAGDTVLLSPACASLDMFDSYEQRGDCFTHAVAQFAQPAKSLQAEPAEGR